MILLLQMQPHIITQLRVCQASTITPDLKLMLQSKQKVILILRSNYVAVKAGGIKLGRTYSTSEIAGLIGIHPNTVRLDEELHLITPPKRKDNGYRVFTELQVDQFINARLAFQVEILQNGLRSLAVDVIRAAADQDFTRAIRLVNQYMARVETEMAGAEEAIRITKALLSGMDEEDGDLQLTRNQAADYLGITIDTLRNWEMNGLMKIKRRQNGYRVYRDADIKRLKIIRALRCANYSLASILRMLRAVSLDPDADLRTAIDTPDDEIITACDSLLSSLSHAGKNAALIHKRLCCMKEKYS